MGRPKSVSGRGEERPLEGRADPGGWGSKPGPPGATIGGGAGGVLPTAFKETTSLPRPGCLGPDVSPPELGDDPFLLLSTAPIAASAPNLTSTYVERVSGRPSARAAVREESSTCRCLELTDTARVTAGGETQEPVSPGEVQRLRPKPCSAQAAI